MNFIKQHLISFVLITAVFSCVAIAGCAARADYRVYDPYYHDYHTWSDGEVVYYHQWEHDTHRHDENFQKRSADEQKEYWDWRHQQDHDHH